MLKAKVTKLNKSRDGQQLDVEVTYFHEEAKFAIDRVFTIGDLARVKENKEDEFIEEFVKEQGQIYKTTLDVSSRMTEKVEINKEITI